MTKDLTTGSPIKSIIRFSLPILIGNLFQQIYNIVDSAIVGKFVGVEALAGVGSTGAINFLIIGFVTGTCAGFCIPISQSYGAGDYNKLRKYYAHAIMIAAVMAVTATTLTLIFIKQILILMQTPDEIFTYAQVYISTIFAGIPGILLYNLLASTLRSIGDSKTPVLFLTGAAFLNVALDLIFIIYFDWGVLGAGLATVISQTTAGVLCLLLIIKKFYILKVEKEDFKFDYSCAKHLCKIGFPMGLQFSITALGSTILQASINGLGAIYVASITAASKINLFAIQGLEAMGLTMATFAGQNLGAKKPERVSIAVKQVLVVGAIYSVLAFVVLQITAPYLSLIFVSADETEIITCICQFLTVNSVAYIFLATLLVLRNTIQGLGYSTFAMIAGGTELLGRGFVALVLVPNFAYAGAIFGNATSWFFAVLFLVPAYIVIYKKVKLKHIS
ncbi:MAG: MATE family efflux transporter [Clostridia bacterium]